jgi:cytochrome P450
MDFLSRSFRQDPYPHYARLQAAAGPVVRNPQGSQWLVLDYAGVKRVLTDHAAFSSQVVPPGGRAPDWMVFSDPPRHTQLRELVNRGFTPRALKGMEGTIERISLELLSSVSGAGEMDLVKDYASRLPTLVMAEILGIPPEQRDTFQSWTEAIMGLSYSALGGPVAARNTERHAQVRAEMEEYLRAALACRRSELLNRLHDEGLELKDILGFFQLLLAAGSETTTHLISNAWLCLQDHPEERERLRGDLSLLPGAIEELLRFRSPGQMMFRATRCEVELQGQSIPAGQFVMAMLGSANRDPLVFPEADCFRPERRPNPHLAFGAGIHFCLGAGLARLEARIALEHLLTRLGHWQVLTPDWEPCSPLHMYGPASLRVGFRSLIAYP